MEARFLFSRKCLLWAATGWAESVGARTAMAGLYSAMEGRIRTAEQGADTAVYLALEVWRASCMVGSKIKPSASRRH